MKTITFAKKDVHDLSFVIASIVREKSDELDFKDIINLQKMVNYFLSVIPDFSKEHDKISDERNSLVEVANKKIAAFKQKLMKNVDKDGKVDEKLNETVQTFVNTSLEEVQQDINATINPKYSELYKGLGSEEVTLEIEEEKLKMLVINFEKYAKEKYTNKSKMVEVYEKLTV